MTGGLSLGHVIDQRVLQPDDWLEVRDPGDTRRLVGRVGAGSCADAEAAVASATRAAAAWAAVPCDQRARALLRVADVLEASAEELSRLLMLEQGMLQSVTRAELQQAADDVRNTVGQGVDVLAPMVIKHAEGTTWVHRRPYGVVVGIVPFNAPIVLAVSVLAPALLAGNTVVLKGSELAPLGLTLLVQRLATLFPPGVINLVNGESEVAEALLASREVRKVSFTGGCATARKVMAACARDLKDLQLELGGNDAALILADADLAHTVPALIPAVFRRSGQFCFAVKRLYVDQRIYERFLGEFCAAVDRLRIGHPMQTGTTLGPVITASRQGEILRLVAQARSCGADVRELGSQVATPLPPGHYLHPTVIATEDHGLDVVQQEQFGPVIPVVPFADDDEAVALANGTEYGLCGSVWAKDAGHAVQVAERMACGRVYINSHRATASGHSHMPFGGLKQSGIGWSNGRYGVEAFTQYHSVDHGTA